MCTRAKRIVVPYSVRRGTLLTVLHALVHITLHDTWYATLVLRTMGEKKDKRFPRVRLCSEMNSAQEVPVVRHVVGTSQQLSSKRHRCPQTPCSRQAQWLNDSIRFHWWVLSWPMKSPPTSIVPTHRGMTTTMTPTCSWYRDTDVRHIHPLTPPSRWPTMTTPPRMSLAPDTWV